MKLMNKTKHKSEQKYTRDHLMNILYLSYVVWHNGKLDCKELNEW